MAGAPGLSELWCQWLCQDSPCWAPIPDFSSALTSGARHSLLLSTVGSAQMWRCNCSSALAVLSLAGEMIPFLLLFLLGAEHTLLHLFSCTRSLQRGDEAVLHQRMCFCCSVCHPAGSFVHFIIPPLPHSRLS